MGHLNWSGVAQSHHHHVFRHRVRAADIECCLHSTPTSLLTVVGFFFAVIRFGSLRSQWNVQIVRSISARVPFTASTLSVSFAPTTRIFALCVPLNEFVELVISPRDFEVDSLCQLYTDFFPPWYCLHIKTARRKAEGGKLTCGNFQTFPTAAAVAMSKFSLSGTITFE